MTEFYWYRKLIALLGVFAVFLLILAPATGVSAQEVTELRIRPESTSATIGEEIVLSVDVLRGVNLSGYDLTIAYDPAVLELVSWAHGAYFSNLAMMKTDLQPGSIRLAAVQIGKPGVSGDGTLLVLTFRAAHTGSTTVGCTLVDLATAEGTRVIPAISDAVVTVNPLPTETLTPTATPTLTLTATRTMTRTPSKTPSVPLTRTPMVTTTRTPTEAGYLPAFTETQFPPDPWQTGTIERAGTPVASITPLPTGFLATVTPSANAIAASPDPTRLSSPEASAESEARLNRLLWGFVLLLVLVLGGMVFILLRHKKSLTGKG
ncbi:MAG: cohesin domain-containing protein [Anaerolineaceae bacterium]